ncbi:MAG: hypothetical protein PHO44_08060 [Sphaerochaetaceae bacterium]|nr:hypothetical protein [Sphaerochaetaceae bacterium]MDD4007920.1 hypothetical protein [Sphaerochaetaceae bacterium]
MKDNLTEVVFVLDRSGSMQGLESDTIGGFNSMIENQKKEEGEALISTVLFNNESKVIHDRVPLEKIQPMTLEQYTVGGSTALLDAMGAAIHHIMNVHKYIRVEDRPRNTIFVITTDGMENSSHQFSFDRVKKLIETQNSKGWEFLFLGANIDAIRTADRFGIDQSRAAGYSNDPTGICVNYESIGEAVSAVRKCQKITGDWKGRIEKQNSKRKKS